MITRIFELQYKCKLQSVHFGSLVNFNMLNYRFMCMLSPGDGVWYNYKLTVNCGILWCLGTTLAYVVYPLYFKT